MPDLKLVNVKRVPTGCFLQGPARTSYQEGLAVLDLEVAQAFVALGAGRKVPHVSDAPDVLVRAGGSVPEAIHAENTQLYCNLRMRLLPGWQIWRASFVDSTGQYSLDSLTFKGARAFLDALSNFPMSREERELLTLVSQAFTGSMPDGILHPIPKSCPYRLASRSIPGLPLRGICVDKLLFPQFVHDGDVWLALGILTRWYNLHYASTNQFLDGEAGRRFGARAWYLPAMDRQRLLYVPMDNAPACLLTLAAH